MEKIDNLENTSKPTLFDSYKLGDLSLTSRIGMCALTRQRADYKTAAPNEMHAKYYSDRADDAGFILTECTAISQNGNSFLGAPGIYTKEQIEGWKLVTEAVHKKNGIIFLQIWHSGRACHKITTGLDVVAPSKIINRHKGRTVNGPMPYDEPEELSEDDIEKIIDLFEQGAKNAKLAGFDGVELHGANGYIVDQFLRDCSNKRTDKYGGSIENRCRFALSVIDKLISVFGSARVGIKLTPCGRFNDMFDSDPYSLCKHLLGELGKKKIAFVEMMQPPEYIKAENHYGVKGEDQIPDFFKTLKPLFFYSEKCDYKPTFIANNNLDLKSATELLENGYCDMVTFGKNYISNPDLVNRLKNNYELTPFDFSTFYSQGEIGYITYKKYSVEDKKEIEIIKV